MMVSLDPVLSGGGWGRYLSRGGASYSTLAAGARASLDRDPCASVECVQGPGSCHDMRSNSKLLRGWLAQHARPGGQEELAAICRCILNGGVLNGAQWAAGLYCQRLRSYTSTLLYSVIVGGLCTYIHNYAMTALSLYTVSVLRYLMFSCPVYINHFCI